VEPHDVGQLFPRTGPGGGNPQAGRNQNPRDTQRGRPDCAIGGGAGIGMEPNVEKVFHDDSVGYRPGRSALDAVTVCRQRCWKKDWVLDLDVRSFFDSVRWDLMLKAVARHTDCRWVLLYVERWLKAPMLMPDGTVLNRMKGTSQGGPISPLIANVFLHYGFDTWLSREFPSITFERYADDAVIHCVTERQARQVWAAVGRRFAEIGLELASRHDADRVLQGQQTSPGL
jgi:RNA-directed DNA polymerase